jgi:hypothetical protein
MEENFEKVRAKNKTRLQRTFKMTLYSLIGMLGIICIVQFFFFSLFTSEIFAIVTGVFAALIILTIYSYLNVADELKK